MGAVVGEGLGTVVGVGASVGTRAVVGEGKGVSVGVITGASVVVGVAVGVAVGVNAEMAPFGCGPQASKNNAPNAMIQSPRTPVLMSLILGISPVVDKHKLRTIE